MSLSKILLLAALSFTGLQATAQQSHQVPAALPDSAKADEEPEYPGGRIAMANFIANHLRYPDEAVANDVSGKVLVRFIVLADGTLSDFKVIQSLGYGCDEEAVRVLKKMPRWKPGKQKGKNINVPYVLPFRFNPQ